MIKVNQNNQTETNSDIFSWDIFKYCYNISMTFIIGNFSISFQKRAQSSKVK